MCDKLPSLKYELDTNEKYIRIYKYVIKSLEERNKYIKETLKRERTENTCGNCYTEDCDGMCQYYYTRY